MLPFHRHHRDKRQTVANLPLSASDFCSGAAPTTELSTDNPYWLACRKKLNECSNTGISPSTPCCITVVSPNYEFCGVSDGLFNNQCTEYIANLYTSTLSCATFGTNNGDDDDDITSDSSNRIPSQISPDLLFSETVGALVIALAISALVIAINPGLPLLNDALIPPGSPLPGSRFGGTIPFGTPASLLSLVPSRLIPISVFPPFVSPRTLEAESILFAEDPDILHLTVKRSIRKKYKWFQLPFVNFYQKLLKNFKCLRTRLFAIGNPNVIQSLRRRTSYIPQYKGKTNENINSLDDCIDGINEPLYGFRTNVTLLRNSPCILGLTCDIYSSSGKNDVT